MNDWASRSKELLPLPQERQLERLCDAFEQAWQSGQPPRLEDYLSELPHIFSSHAFVRLLPLELELRRKAGEQLDPQEYVTRFPDDAETIAWAFEQDRLTDAASMESTRSGLHLDTNNLVVRADADSSVEAEEEIPQRLGRYSIRKLLGDGGFGRVFLAQDTALDRSVAVKVPRKMFLKDKKQLSTFMQEARTAAGLKHPSIVAVHDIYHEDDGAYIVQEFIDGPSLSEWIKTSGGEPRDVATLFTEIAGAVGFLHQQRIVHRDLKPGNILLDREGHAHVADFGLAVHESQQWNRAGEIAGTFHYMSPEQLRGETHLLDGQSDLWSLGVIFYEMLVGDRPFSGSTPRELCDKIRTRDPRPLRQLAPHIPAELERICLKCLQRRRANRYLSTADLIVDLQHWLATPHHTAPPALTGNQAIPAAVVPKGLRSFDEGDASFFLELLPGPRHRDGLPESVHFWKSRIERMDPDRTFPVGLILGPSGCGKSSLLKAALLPRLDSSVIRVFVEAAAEDTEVRLLNGLKRQLPHFPDPPSLPELLRELRENGVGEGRKLLIVLDQFEQWLHAHSMDTASHELIDALRHCDGGTLQCLVLARDDFWMPCYRFFEELDIELGQAHNFAVVDRFDTRHAEKVLRMFGRSLGALSEDSRRDTPEQNAFVSKAIVELAGESGRVICVHLALFSEMVKSLPWRPSTLLATGGTAGVGVSFLEESLVHTRHPRHKLHLKAARAVLQALLPDSGSDIRGNMRSYEELLQKSGYAHREAAFADVMAILDSELRLVTPTDPEGQANDRGETSSLDRTIQYYQLTHDYLVPSLRQWLTAKQRETRAGRAELKLAERATLWIDQPENRYLPSLAEFTGIAWHTDKSTWKHAQRAMMVRAARYYSTWLGAIVGMLIVLVGAGLIVQQNIERRNRLNKVDGLVDALRKAPLDLVPGIVDEIDAYRPLAREPLSAIYAESADASPEKLRAALGLLPQDPDQVGYLLSRMLASQWEEFPVLRDALAPHAEAVVAKLWATITDEESNRLARLYSGLALAAFRPNSEQWSDDHAAFLSEQLVNATDNQSLLLRESLGPIKDRLIPHLRPVLADPIERRRDQAAAALAVFLADDPAELAQLISESTDAQHHFFMHAIFQDPKTQDQCKSIFAGMARERPAADMTAAQRVQLGQRRARAAIGAIVLGNSEPVRAVLDVRDDPESLTQLVHGVRSRGVTASHLLTVLSNTPQSPARYGLLLALGEFDWNELPETRRDHIQEQLIQWYRTDPSSRIHGACGWLLHKWGFENEVEQVDQTVLAYDPSGERDWFVKKVSVPSEGDDLPARSLYFTFVVFEPGKYVFRFPMNEREPQNDELREVELPYPIAICDREMTWRQLPNTEQTRNRLKVVDTKESNFETRLDHPASALSWYDAVMVCRWLTQHAGYGEDEQCYADPNTLQDAPKDKTKNACMFLPSGPPPDWPMWLERSGFRLPTEDEWEVASRSGTKTTYSFGEDPSRLKHYGWYMDNAEGRMHFGAQLRPNPRGLFDVHGNANEWCANRFSSQNTSALLRAFRGGGWRNNSFTSRPGRRRGSPPVTLADTMGFRLALVPRSE